MRKHTHIDAGMIYVDRERERERERDRQDRWTKNGSSTAEIDTIPPAYTHRDDDTIHRYTGHWMYCIQMCIVQYLLHFAVDIAFSLTFSRALCV